MSTENTEQATQVPWSRESHLGHGRGGNRHVIVAGSYEKRVAVVSLNGIANGDQAIAGQISELIEQAPAMALALRLLAEGRATFAFRPGGLCELVLHGVHYCLNGDWNGLLSTIGWDNARKALEDLK